MKKVTVTTHIILVLVIALLPMAVFGQNWIRTYDTTTFIESLMPLNDGGVLAIGHNNQNLGAKDSFFLLKIDKNGQLLKSKLWIIKNTALMPLVQQTKDSSFLFVVIRVGADSPLTVVKFSKNLDSVWSKNINPNATENVTAKTFKKLSDGTFGITCKSKRDTVYLLKINGNGDTLRSKNFGRFFGDADSGIIDFFEETNGNLKLLSSGYNFRGSSMIEVDSLFQLINVVELIQRYVYYRFFKTTDENFLFASVSVTKIRKDGTFIWGRSENDFKVFLAGTVQLRDGSFACIGHSELINGIRKNRLFKLSNDGNIDSICYIPMQIGRLGYGIWRTYIDSNDHILYCGLAQDTITGKYKGYVAKMDLNCVLSATIEDNVKSPVSIYPNPVMDNALIDIHSRQLIGNESSFLLFDICGKWVKTEKFMGNQYSFKRQNLTSGLYIFQIKNNGQLIANGKLIIN